MDDVIGRFLEPDRIAMRAEALASPSPVPAEGGVYGWWFRSLPAPLDTAGCVTRDGLTLLYVGISPQAPPTNGRGVSHQNLRTRICTHFAGNAEASTLRKTLGCLLADQLGIELRRVGSGQRHTFVDGEPVLSEWMAENALVSWVACERPWEVEEQLISRLDLPLNLDGNDRHPFRRQLSAKRSAAVRHANELPVVPNPGVGGRFRENAPANNPFRGCLGTQSASVARALLGRLVLTGIAATADRSSVENAQLVLGAAFEALHEKGVTIGLLVTPAGLVEHRVGRSWSGRNGWGTEQRDFDELAQRASAVASEILTPALRLSARGAVENLVLGIDVWPTAGREPHAEVACLYEVASDSLRPVTGKSYPTPAQEDVLIRNPDLASHIVQIGNEQVAVLVCHDLAAWNPRGKRDSRGDRAKTWRAMHELVRAARPTLAVQLPHTVAKAGTWRNSWLSFARQAGSTLHSGTSAVRYLDLQGQPVNEPIGDRLLSVPATGCGERTVDVVISGRADPTWMPPAGPRGLHGATPESERELDARSYEVQLRAQTQRASSEGRTMGETVEQTKARVTSRYVRDQVEGLEVWIDKVTAGRAVVDRSRSGPGKSDRAVKMGGRKVFSYYFANDWIHFYDLSPNAAEEIWERAREASPRDNVKRADSPPARVRTARDLDCVLPTLQRLLNEEA